MTSTEMNDRILRSMRRTWDVIAGDILDVSPGGECTQDVVIEMVLDADRMQVYGHDDEAYQAVRAMPWAEAEALGRLAFPYDTYC